MIDVTVITASFNYLIIKPTTVPLPSMPPPLPPQPPIPPLLSPIKRVYIHISNIMRARYTPDWNRRCGAVINSKQTRSQRHPCRADLIVANPITTRNDVRVTQLLPVLGASPAIVPAACPPVITTALRSTATSTTRFTNWSFELLFYSFSAHLQTHSLNCGAQHSHKGDMRIVTACVRPRAEQHCTCGSLLAVK